jgi:hypothetical protein
MRWHINGSIQRVSFCCSPLKQGINRLTHTADNDPEIIKVRRLARYEKLSYIVEKTVDGWPALSDEQLDSVAALLRADGREQYRDHDLAGTGTV